MSFNIINLGWPYDTRMNCLEIRSTQDPNEHQTRYLSDYDNWFTLRNTDSRIQVRDSVTVEIINTNKAAIDENVYSYLSHFKQAFIFFKIL